VTIPATEGAHEGGRPSSWIPVPYRVVARHSETSDVVTLALEPPPGEESVFRAGQFNMLSVFGVGEVAVSVSSSPGVSGSVEHTVRDVGAVTHALCNAALGSVVGVRGPFGNDWGIDELAGHDVVVVAGGIGLAPLRGAVRSLVRSLADPTGGCSPTGTARRVEVLVGARSPSQIVFSEDIERWRESGAQVEVSVDVADSSWPGHVGVVTTMLAGRRFEPARTTALVCGPEVMMRFTARALLDSGVLGERIRLSLERNMQCGIGLCGHCQLGPLLLCRDGPVVTFAGPVPRLLSAREL
jgi:anaerobic sulfite reductase subunit B